MGSNPTLSAMNHMVHGSAILYGIPMPSFHYVYVLRSLHDGKLYIGSTADLRERRLDRCGYRDR